MYKSLCNGIRLKLTSLISNALLIVGEWKFVVVLMVHVLFLVLVKFNVQII